MTATESKIKAARNAAGLSQSQAALPLIAAGIIASKRTLQNWELGRGESIAPTKQAAALAALRSPKKSRSRKGQNDCGEGRRTQGSEAIDQRL